MNKIRLILFLIFIFHSCHSQTTFIDKKVIDFVPDISVNNIMLEDEKSVTESLGDIYERLDFQEDFPFYILTNIDGRQYFKLVYLSGNIFGRMSQFEVGYTNTYIGNNSNYEYFETESGIKLGISLETLCKIKGNNYTTYCKNDTTIYKYEISDISTSYFLQKYNMPVYFAEYWICGNKLIKFLFGFDYP
jgi:hypothetical protein